MGYLLKCHLLNPTVISTARNRRNRSVYLPCIKYPPRLLGGENGRPDGPAPNYTPVWRVEAATPQSFGKLGYARY